MRGSRRLALSGANPKRAIHPGRDRSSYGDCCCCCRWHTARRWHWHGSGRIDWFAVNGDVKQWPDFDGARRLRADDRSRLHYPRRDCLDVARTTTSAMNAAPTLSLRNIHKSFGGIVAVEDLSLD